MSETTRPDVMLAGDAASIHVRRLAEGLRDRGSAVEVAGFEGAELPGVRLHRLGTLGAERDRRYALGIPSLARLIRSRRPRLLNAHYLTSFGVMTAAARWLAHPSGAGPPLVQTIWGDDLLVTPRGSPLHRRLASRALMQASLVTGDSRDLEAAARALAPSVAWHRFVFGPPDELLAATTNKARLMVSTRLHIPAMRVDRIVAAFLRFLEAEPQSTGWELRVVGAGPETDRLMALAAGNPAITFPGALSHHALMQLLLEASIVVSVPESDATSATLLESLAAGAIPVVNDLPANREWVSPDIGEIVAPDPAVADLAAALQRAATREPDVEATRRVVAGNTWERELNRLVEAFESVMSTGERAR